MHVTIENEVGLSITLHPAHVIHATTKASSPGGGRGVGQATPVPRLTVEPTLIADLVEGRPVQVSSMSLYFDDWQVSVLVACGSDAATVLMLDVGHPEVRSWLGTARSDGAVPLLLCDGDGWHQVKLSLTESLREAFRQSPAPAVCPHEMLYGAFIKVLESLEETAALEQLGIDPAKQRRVSLSIIGESWGQGDEVNSAMPTRH